MELEESHNRSRIDSTNNRRKESDIGSVGLDTSTFVKERHTAERNKIIPMCSMPERIPYTDLVNPNENSSSLIFHKLKYEINQNSSEYTVLKQMQSDNEFCIMIKTQSGLLLVRLNSEDAVPETRTEPTLGKPEVNKDRNNLRESAGATSLSSQGQLSSKSAKSSLRVSPKVLVISFFSTNHDEATNPGDIHLHLPKIEKILVMKTVEKFKNYFNKVEQIRLDSVIAKYFLAQNSRTFSFQIPKVTDKASFLFLLKQNFLSQRSMHKVVGNLDSKEFLDSYIMGNPDSKSFAESELRVDDPGPKSSVSQHVAYTITPTSTDQCFFFASDIDTSSLGTVQFMFKIGESTIQQKYYTEFESLDGLYTNLLRYDDTPDIGGEFHTLAIKDGQSGLSANISAVNDAGLITHMSEKPNIKSRDRIQFSVFLRGELADKNLIEFLETALKHSYMELLIEQWIHTLYLKSTQTLTFECQEVEILKNIQSLYLASVAPSSVMVKEVCHKLQSANYLVDFVPAVFDSVFKELGNSFKQQSSARQPQPAKDPRAYFEYAFHFQQGEDAVTFSQMEDLSKYLSSRSTNLVGSGLTHTTEDNFELQPIKAFVDNLPDETLLGVSKAASPERNHQDATFHYAPSNSSAAGTNLSHMQMKPGDETNTHRRMKSQNHKSLGSSMHMQLSIPSAVKINHPSFNILKYLPAEPGWKFSLILRPKVFGQEKGRMGEEASRFYNQLSEEKTGVAAVSPNQPTEEANQSCKKVFQLPLRRFLFGLEFTPDTVRLTSYNFKEEIYCRVLDRVLAEVTFHELREKLILGLATQKMGQEFKAQTEDPEFAVNYGEIISARSDLVIEEERKKQRQDAEAAIRMRAARVRQELDESAEEAAKQSKGTFTSRVLSMLDPVSKLDSATILETTPANPRYPEDVMKISQAIDSMISNVHLKIASGEIDSGYQFVDQPKYLKKSTARTTELQSLMGGVMGASISEMKEHSDGEIRPPRKQSGRIANSRFKFQARAWKLTAKRTETEDQDSSDDTMTVSKGETQVISGGRLYCSDQEDGADMETGNEMLVSPDSGQVGQFYRSKSLQESELNAVTAPSGASDLPNDAEKPPAPIAETALNNLKLLQSNLTLHIFDHFVRKIFDLEPAKAVARFNKICHKRKIWLT